MKLCNTSRTPQTTKEKIEFLVSPLKSDKQNNPLESQI